MEIGKKTEIESVFMFDIFFFFLFLFFSLIIAFLCLTDHISNFSLLVAANVQQTDRKAPSLLTREESPPLEVKGTVKHIFLKNANLRK